MATTRARSPAVVVFAANPTTTSPLDLEGELRAITAELEIAGVSGALRFIKRISTTPADVQRTLLVEHVAVVQFSGHGRGRFSGGEPRSGATSPAGRARRDLTGIMLHDEDDPSSVRLLSGEALGDLFAKVGSSVQLVFLNACHSDQQAAAILEHVDFVVGVSGSITDEAARVFAVALYRALALGRSVKTAFDLGVNALMLEGLEADVRLPVLRARPGADPSSVTLVDAPPLDDGTAWDVYIAYAKPDREPVCRLAKELHHRHLRVFFDEWEIGPGDAVVRRREEGIYGSTHGLVIVSSLTMEQPWVQKEYEALLDMAVMEGKLLIPVLLGDRSDDAGPPRFLRTLHPVDLRGVSADAYREGVEAIAGALKGRRPGPPPRVR